MNYNLPIVIIGGGPAGFAAGISLLLSNNTANVILIEKNSKPGGFDSPVSSLCKRFEDLGGRMILFLPLRLISL